MNAEYDWTLSRGVVFSADRFYVLAYSRREPGTRVFRWTGKWDNYYVPCKTAGICAIRYPQPEIVTLCLDGTVHSAGPNGFLTDVIGKGLDDPSRRGALRCISAVNNEVYAAGLGRQVFKRISTRRWIRFDEKIVEPIGSEEIGGFESIDGYSTNEVYAVGMNGQFYFYDGVAWAQVNGLTNLALEKVLCAPNGSVYAAGQLGIIIKGRGPQWEIIDQDIIDDTVWDLAWFRDKLWLSTVNSLYVTEDDAIENVVLGESNSSFRYLAGDEEVLWSIGSRDLFLNKNGVWNAVPTP